MNKYLLKMIFLLPICAVLGTVSFVHAQQINPLQQAVHESATRWAIFAGDFMDIGLTYVIAGANNPGPGPSLTTNENNLIMSLNSSATSLFPSGNSKLQTSLNYYLAGMINSVNYGGYWTLVDIATEAPVSQVNADWGRFAINTVTNYAGVTTVLPLATAIATQSNIAFSTPQAQQNFQATVAYFLYYLSVYFIDLAIAEMNVATNNTAYPNTTTPSNTIALQENVRVVATILGAYIGYVTAGGDPSNVQCAINLL